MNKPLSPRQITILRFLIDHQKRNGYAPTQVEIAAKIETSLSSVVYHLNRLEFTGAIDRSGANAHQLGGGRTIVVTNAGKNAIGEPLTPADKKAEREAHASVKLAKMTAELRTYYDLRVQYEDLQIDPCQRVERQRVMLKMGEQRCKLFDLLEVEN